MDQIGPACNYRGVRVPYRKDLKSAFDEVPGASFRTHLMLTRPRKSFFPYSAVPEAQRALAA
jgi:hypothetical protein